MQDLGEGGRRETEDVLGAAMCPTNGMYQSSEAHSRRARDYWCVFGVKIREYIW
jgi:hypothetical protein